MSKRWYVVHTYSGYENRVKSDLEHRIETMGMQDRIFDIQIPTEHVTELKEGGKRDEKDVKIFPGYVLVRMEMDDDAWTCVRNTPGVTGFLGGSGKPAPLSRDEYNKMMRKTDKGSSAPKRAVVDIEVGTSIRVTNGPLADFDRQGLRGYARAGQGQGHAPHLRPRDAGRAWVRADRGHRLVSVFVRVPRFESDRSSELVLLTRMR